LAPVATSSSRKRPAQSTQSGEIRSNAGLPVYVDDEFVSEEDRQRRGPQPKTQPAAIPGWASLPSEAERHKENIDKATKWTGQSIPQNPFSRAAGARFTSSLGSTGAAFEVFQDEGIATPSSVAPQPRGLNVLKARLEDDASRCVRKEVFNSNLTNGTPFDVENSLAKRNEQLLANPLKMNYKFAVKTEKYERQTNDPKLQKGGTYEKWMFNATLVYPGDGFEYSFEELRLNQLVEYEAANQQMPAMTQAPSFDQLPGGGIVTNPLAGIPAPMALVNEPAPQPSQQPSVAIVISPSQLLLSQSPLGGPALSSTDAENGFKPFSDTSPTQTPTLHQGTLPSTQDM